MTAAAGSWFRGGSARPIAGARPSGPVGPSRAGETSAPAEAPLSHPGAGTSAAGSTRADAVATGDAIAASASLASTASGAPAAEPVPDGTPSEAPEFATEEDLEEGKPPSPAELRARRIATLAGYGDTPARWHQSIPYAVRVMTRRHQLDVKLAAISATCARAESACDEVLAEVGEALFVMRKDARVEVLAERATKVEEAIRLANDIDAAAQGDVEGARRALAALAPQIVQAEAEAGEARADEARVRTQYDALAARLRQAEAAHARVVQAVQLLQATPPVDRARLATLASEREARNAERRYLEVQISPTETELGEAQRELAGREQTLSALLAQRTAIEDAAGRALASREASLAAAEAMRFAGLVGLARAAMQADVVGFAGDAAERAEDALARVQVLRDEEDLYKRARDSFDEHRYRQGLTIMVGTSVAAFVVLAGLILF